MNDQARRARDGDSEAGMVTGEVAMGILAIGVVVTLLAMLANIAFVYVGAQEAARTAARMASLGKSESAIVAVVREKVPGATLEVEWQGQTVEVAVHAPRSGFSGALGVAVSARTSAFAEPGVMPDG
ncbi:MAG: TadE family type IV pilus minor pilin [Actinomycetaceae bacterium]|nr:TadE family type IV pilus minor pilin [Actinomycetaceae bacterium]